MSQDACPERPAEEGLIKASNNAGTTIYSIEKSLSEYKEKVLVDVVNGIESAMAELRVAMQKDDADLIKDKIDAANKAVSEIG